VLANIDPDLADCRDALLIAGFRKPSLEDYGRIVQMEIEAIKAGYAKLA